MRSRPPHYGGGAVAGSRRNVPVRSHSMSIADINRFYGSPPLPRFRPPPPPNPGGSGSTAQRNTTTTATGGAKIEITELGADSGSEIEDAEMHLQRQTTKKQKTKKHFIHHNNQVIIEDLPNDKDVDFSRKYKTLDPTNRVRSHHQQMTNAEGNYNSLERGTRRKLPTVPNSQSHNSLNTQSLPRPPKGNIRREQSESRSRDRLERLRSQSFDEEATNRRQLPNVPKKPVRQTSAGRDNREPTPDYDSTGDNSSTEQKQNSPLASSPVKAKSDSNSNSPE